MLAGLRSRWMIPFPCATSSASAIWRAMASASVNRDGSSRNPIGQRRSFDEFEHEGAHAVALLESIDSPDVRIVQRGQHARFAVETSQAVRVSREHTRQDLDGHVAPEFQVARAIDLAHAASPDSGLDLIHTETPARQHGSVEVAHQLGRHRDRGFVQERVGTLREQRLDLLPQRRVAATHLGEKRRARRFVVRQSRVVELLDPPPAFGRHRLADYTYPLPAPAGGLPDFGHATYESRRAHDCTPPAQIVARRGSGTVRERQ